jgi:hypothetical protein
MTKDALKALIAECLATCGEDTTVRLLDAMKRLSLSVRNEERHQFFAAHKEASQLMLPTM